MTEDLFGPVPDQGKKRQKKAARESVYYRREAEAVLDFLNTRTGRGYRAAEADGSASVNVKLIAARLRSGVTADQCRQVIAKKLREWKGDPRMLSFLRPATLFNKEKFEQYLGELGRPKEKKEG